MASIKSQLSLTDGMTPVLRNVTRALDLVLDSFEELQQASGAAIDTANIDAARAVIDQVRSSVDDLEQSLADSGEEQERLNRSFKTGESNAGALLDKVKGIATAYLGMKGVKWLEESFGLFDTQNNAEIQLAVSLRNMGAAESAIDTLKQRAAELQGVTVYGDEALIGGAAEFATYMTDEAAISKMMGTLTNYAAGMSGGGAVGYSEMVDYATQLGKVLNGSFDGIAKKGFEVSDVQKEILENGSDMEKALVVDEIINESWDNLAKTMAKTPTGKITQMKNEWADMREEIAGNVYPTVMRLFDTIRLDGEDAREVIDGISTAINLAVTGFEKALKAAKGVYDFIDSHWTLIEPIILGIVGALLLYKVTTGAVSVVLGILSAAQALFSGQTLAAAAAQHGLNAAMWACPVTWILAGILLLVAVMLLLWENCEGFREYFADTWRKNADALMGFYNNAVVPVANWFFAAQSKMAIATSSFAGTCVNAWFDLASGVMDAVSWIAEKLSGLIELYNSVASFFGQATISVKGIDSFAAGLEDQRQYILSELDSYAGKYGTPTVLNKVNMDTFGAAADEMRDKIKDFTISGWLKDKWQELKDGFAGNGDEEEEEEEGGGNNEEILENTDEILDALKSADEDLAYLRDIAEMEAINRFTTAEVKIDMTGMTNRIDSDMDLDGVLTVLTDGFAEALEIAAEGAHQ